MLARSKGEAQIMFGRRKNASRGASGGGIDVGVSGGEGVAGP
jgi:hypothetical protein